MCTMAEEYSITSCIMDYVFQQTGCLFQAQTNTLTCKRSEDVSKYFHTLVWAKTASVDELYQKTNCLPKCSWAEYQVRKGCFIVSDRQMIMDPTKWIKFLVFKSIDTRRISCGNQLLVQILSNGWFHKSWPPIVTHHYRPQNLCFWERQPA